MDKAEATEGSKASESKQDKSNGDTTDPSSITVDIEDDKERAIAKAALTIAELS